ncbi:AAA family ATPase [Vulcanisaeta thermophila]|uniref:AAA family ATPase n=1 Tax=Vulcanisaeta thermophila TaxID=867917 RepID=UPI000852A49F|nr:AAA family ATPase [Vulcanisaeta thermophila]
MRVIVITGLPGSGKTVATEVARELGLPVVTMGDVIRDEALRMGIPEGRASVVLRLRGGTRYIAHRVLEKIPRGAEAVVVDGARSIRELEAIEDALSTSAILIYITAPWRVRYERLRSRGRPDDPKSLEDFLMRDLRELRYGLGDLMARADYILVNDAGLEEFRSRVRDLLIRITRQ